MTPNLADLVHFSSANCETQAGLDKIIHLGFSDTTSGLLLFIAIGLAPSFPKSWQLECSVFYLCGVQSQELTKIKSAYIE